MNLTDARIAWRNDTTADVDVLNGPGRNFTRTYRFLRDLEFNEDDFVEVGPPVCPDCMRDNEPNGLDTWDF